MSAFEPASALPPPPPRPPAVSDTQLALAVYILYLVGFFTAITALVGVIIAYAQIDKAGDMLRSHYRFQIRTFWLALLFSVASIILTPVGIGVVALVATGLWLVVRGVVGLSTLLKGQPYPTPKNWML